MRKVNKAFGFKDFEALEGIVYSDHVPSVVDPVPGKNDSLFDLIFAVNPKTGLPDGDLAVWMSENTSPDIKRFIELNLHGAVPSDLSSSDVDDDTLAELTRGSDESIQDYRDRMVDYVRRTRSEYLNEKKSV